MIQNNTIHEMLKENMEGITTFVDQCGASRQIGLGNSPIWPRQILQDLGPLGISGRISTLGASYRGCFS